MVMGAGDRTLESSIASPLCVAQRGVPRMDGATKKSAVHHTMLPCARSDYAERDNSHGCSSGCSVCVRGQTLTESLLP